MFIINIIVDCNAFNSMLHDYLCTYSYFYFYIILYYTLGIIIIDVNFFHLEYSLVIVIL